MRGKKKEGRFREGKKGWLRENSLSDNSLTLKNPTQTSLLNKSAKEK
jgi:hypothetical protein